MQTTGEQVAFVGHGTIFNSQQVYNSTDLTLHGAFDGKMHTVKVTSNGNDNDPIRMVLKLESAAFGTATGSQLRLLSISWMSSQSSCWDLLVNLTNGSRAIGYSKPGRPSIDVEHSFSWRSREGHFCAVFLSVLSDVRDGNTLLKFMSLGRIPIRRSMQRIPATFASRTTPCSCSQIARAVFPSYGQPETTLLPGPPTGKPCSIQASVRPALNCRPWATGSRSFNKISRASLARAEVVSHRSR